MNDGTWLNDGDARRQAAGRWPRRLALALALTAILPGATAWAHKMTVFATVQGKVIHGEVYYQDGSPAPQVKVSVLGPDDVALGSVTTDQQGAFRYDPQSRCPHRFVADGGFGHRAEYTVPMDDLPPELAAGPPDPTPSPVRPAPATSPDSHGEAPSGSPSDLAGEIEALNRQVAALRQELGKWKTALRMQDVLGGVGYILGILGIASYFLAGRRRERSALPKA